MIRKATGMITHYPMFQNRATLVKKNMSTYQLKYVSEGWGVLLWIQMMLIFFAVPHLLDVLGLMDLIPVWVLVVFTLPLFYLSLLLTDFLCTKRVLVEVGSKGFRGFRLDRNEEKGELLFIELFENMIESKCWSSKLMFFVRTKSKAETNKLRFRSSMKSNVELDFVNDLSSRLKNYNEEHGTRIKIH